MCPYACNHTGQHILATEHAPDFGLDARPGAGAEFAQKLSIEAGVQSQTLGDGQHDLPVRDGKTDLFGHVHGGHEFLFPEPFSSVENLFAASRR